MKKNILFLITSLEGGGAEKVLIDLIKNLNPLKYDITVQTVLNEGIYINKLPDHVKYKTIINVKNRYIRSIFIRLFYYILSPKYIHNKYINSNYDIEIAYLEGICTKYISVSTNRNSSKYAWIHTDLFNNFKINKIYKNLNSLILSYRNFDKIIFVSQSAKKAFEKRFGYFDNTYVLYNVVDSENIILKGSEEIPKELINNNFKIVTVGRLVAQKGYDRLLEIHKRLISEGFSYELWIIGDGVEKENLNLYIKNNNLTNSVKLLGFQENPYKYMSKCDLFVCSSRAEGYSTAVTEALILKLPVITTDCSGMKELLENGKYGMIIENNTDDLYKGLKKILSDKSLYRYYRDRAKERSYYFDMKKQIYEYEKLFDEVERINEN